MSRSPRGLAFITSLLVAPILCGVGLKLEQPLVAYVAPLAMVVGIGLWAGPEATDTTSTSSAPGVSATEPRAQGTPVPGAKSSPETTVERVLPALPVLPVDPPSVPMHPMPTPGAVDPPLAV